MDLENSMQRTREFYNTHTHTENHERLRVLRIYKKKGLFAQEPQAQTRDKREKLINRAHCSVYSSLQTHTGTQKVGINDFTAPFVVSTFLFSTYNFHVDALENFGFIVRAQQHRKK